jgi:asparagine synthase (glutamine-hydrolysing)
VARRRWEYALSVFAAFVEFDNPLTSTNRRSRDVVIPIRRLPIDEVCSATPPGAVFGFGLIAADSARRVDQQPLVDERMQMAIVADCRLDNREEIRGALGLNDSCTDARLLLTAYDRWGTDLGAHLLGDFAIAFWDWRQRTVVLLRDHVGVKPLYYWNGQREFAVSTDVGVLIDLIKPQPTPDDTFVVEHLMMEYRSTDRTFWAEIRRLPGGHLLEASADRSQVRRYWHPPVGEIRSKSTAEIHEDLRTIFFESVERRLNSDTPLVAHLSGGLDSSGIVCVANEIYKRAERRPPLVLASWLFPGLSCDESEFIQAVAARMDFEAESWDERSEGLSPLFTPTLLGPGMGSDPSGDLRLGARIGAKALLSGQGGDYLCGCEGVAEDIAEARPAHVVFKRILGGGVPVHLRVARARSLLRRQAPMAVRRAVGNMRGRLGAPLWLHRQWRGLAGSLAARGYPDHRGARSHVAARHWQAIGSSGLGLLLESEQHRATASGLEFRYPFLDVKLIEYVLSIPFEHWPEAAPYARLHREFLGRYLPESVRQRTKATFSAGVAYRMKLAWPRIRSLFFEGEWHAARYVNRLYAQELIAPGGDGIGEDDWERWRGIWAIALLEAWLRRISEYSSFLKRRRDEQPA